MPDLGKSIKRIRKEKGYSQKQLAEKLGTTPQNLAQYENGKRTPKIETLNKIATALGVNITDITNEYYEIGIEERPDLGPILSKAIISTDKMDEIILINYYRQLSDAGKNEAHKRIGELTLLDVYKSTTTHSGPIIKYTPNDISAMNAFYDELHNQENLTLNPKKTDSSQD